MQTRIDNNYKNSDPGLILLYISALLFMVAIAFSIVESGEKKHQKCQCCGQTIKTSK